MQEVAEHRTLETLDVRCKIKIGRFVHRHIHGDLADTVFTKGHVGHNIHTALRHVGYIGHFHVQMPQMQDSAVLQMRRQYLNLHAREITRNVVDNELLIHA